MQSTEDKLGSDKPESSGTRPGIVFRRLVYVALALAATWLIAVSVLIIVFERRLGPAPWANLGPRQTGYSFVDGLVRYLSSVSRSGFSPIEFFSIEFWSLYLTVFLASLGAVGGLLKLYQGLQAPSKKDFSAEKRDNTLILVCALASSVILGSSAVLASVRKKYLLQRFYALEVHLVRFEGLMFNSLSVTANRGLIDTFFEYMLGYYGRIQTLMTEISYSYDFTDQDQISEEMLKFERSVQKLKVGGSSDKTETNDTVLGEVKTDSTLLDLLQSLEFLQEAVRRHIRGLER